jgi:hypothetical protein
MYVKCIVIVCTVEKQMHILKKYDQSVCLVKDVIVGCNQFSINSFLISDYF